ncbi:NfeD family protein [Marinobacterium sp. YM272]|uniref:NfeD family protein n=1 Tax=Marinobacterium sp. YM272 TaxID=3421654 RepID=UPI003D7FA9B0
MELLASYLIELLAILGLALLAIEVWVLGVSTLVLLFAGIALLLTSLSMYLGLIPDTWQWALIATTGFTVLTGAILWPIFKRLQQTSEHKAVTSDLIGHSFYLPADTSVQNPTSYRFSGVSWQVISQEELSKGTLVEVVDLQVGQLFVRAKQPE